MTVKYSDKYKNVIKAAIEIIATKGFEHAKITEIADKAGVASGLIYSRKFFINKLDILLSIVLHFWEILNDKIVKEVSCSEMSSAEKLKHVFHLLNEILVNDKEGIYLSKVLHNSLPIIAVIKEEELQNKRVEIRVENRKFLKEIDDFIKDGQKNGEFDNTLPPAAMRQVLYGSFELLMYGLFLELSEREEHVGYNRKDINKVMIRIIDKFIVK